MEGVIESERDTLDADEGKLVTNTASYLRRGLGNSPCSPFGLHLFFRREREEVFYVSRHWLQIQCQRRAAFVVKGLPQLLQDACRVPKYLGGGQKLHSRAQSGGAAFFVLHWVLGRRIPQECKVVVGLPLYNKQRANACGSGRTPNRHEGKAKYFQRQAFWLHKALHGAILQRLF